MRIVDFGIREMCFSMEWAPPGIHLLDLAWLLAEIGYPVTGRVRVSRGGEGEEIKVPVEEVARPLGFAFPVSRKMVNLIRARHGDTLSPFELMRATLWQLLEGENLPMELLMPSRPRHRHILSLGEEMVVREKRSGRPLLRVRGYLEWVNSISLAKTLKVAGLLDPEIDVICRGGRGGEEDVPLVDLEELLRKNPNLEYVLQHLVNVKITPLGRALLRTMGRRRGYPLGSSPQFLLREALLGPVNEIYLPGEEDVIVFEGRELVGIWRGRPEGMEEERYDLHVIPEGFPGAQRVPSHLKSYSGFARLSTEEKTFYANLASVLRRSLKDAISVGVGLVLGMDRSEIMVSLAHSARTGQAREREREEYRYVAIQENQPVAILEGWGDKPGVLRAHELLVRMGLVRSEKGLTLKREDEMGETAEGLPVVKVPPREEPRPVPFSLRGRILEEVLKAHDAMGTSSISAMVGLLARRACRDLELGGGREIEKLKSHRKTEELRMTVPLERETYEALLQESQAEGKAINSVILEEMAKMVSAGVPIRRYHLKNRRISYELRTMEVEMRDGRRVYIAGVPPGITPSDVRKFLREKGFTPKDLRGCLIRRAREVKEPLLHYPGDRRKYTLSVRLPEHLLGEVVKLARERKTTLTHIVEEAARAVERRVKGENIG